MSHGIRYGSHCKKRSQRQYWCGSREQRLHQWRSSLPQSHHLLLSNGPHHCLVLLQIVSLLVFVKFSLSLSHSYTHSLTHSQSLTRSLTNSLSLSPRLPWKGLGPWMQELWEWYYISFNIQLLQIFHILVIASLFTSIRYLANELLLKVN